MTTGRARPAAARPGGDGDDLARVLSFVLDADGFVVDVSDTAARLLGIGRRDVLHMPLLNWVDGADRSEFLSHLSRCRRERDVVETELRLRAADGACVPVCLRSRRTGTGHPRVPTVAIDLSAREELETARLVAEAERDTALTDRELERQASAEKDRWIATAAHELRSPLSPALVAARALTLHPDDPARVIELAGVIARSIELESRLIDDLLDAARIARGHLDLKLARIDACAVLDETVSALEPSAALKGLTVVRRYGSEAPATLADAGRLRQVFWNVLHNAIKFSERGSIRVTTADRGDRLRISVEDSGAGMEEPELRSLFVPFAGRRSDRRGLGLGASIAKGIIDAHGGTMSAVSAGRGRGTTIEIELPSAPPLAFAGATGPDVSPPHSDTTTPPEAGSRAAAALRVLVVDDDVDTASLVRLFLVDHGGTVHVAHSLAEGLAALEHHWDVVIADIGLPDGSGIEIARQARALADPPERIIALSGYGSQQDLAASRQAGFDEYLVKPVDPDRLLGVLPRRHGGRPL